MQHKFIGILDDNEGRIAYNSYLSRGTNSADRSKMKNFLSLALGDDLTPRQRDCVKMYYFDGMKMREIAKALDIHPSTVTRHLQVSRRKLKNLSKYV